MLLVRGTHKRPWTGKRSRPQYHSCFGTETERGAQTRPLLHRRSASTGQGRANSANKETPHVATQTGTQFRQEPQRCSIGGRAERLRASHGETSKRVVAQHNRRQNFSGGPIPKGLLSTSPFEVFCAFARMYPWDALRIRFLAERELEGGAKAPEAHQCEIRWLLHTIYGFSDAACVARLCSSSCAGHGRPLR
jgi:hypothetical protein